MNGDIQKKKDEAKAEAKARIWKDIERTGDNDLVPCDKAAYAKLQELFDKTVAEAIQRHGPEEWTNKAAQKFIRRHVKLIARVAKRLAQAGKEECVSAQDLQDAADMVIRRAKAACKKKMTQDEINLLGHPCDHY